MATYYYLRPVAGFSFVVGQQLVPMYEFPENVRLVRVRGWNEHAPCGFAENDGAEDLRKRKASLMEVVKVSDISGFAVATVLECKSDV